MTSQQVYRVLGSGQDKEGLGLRGLLFWSCDIRAAWTANCRYIDNCAVVPKGGYLSLNKGM